jgi:hypothetical protein
MIEIREYLKQKASPVFMMSEMSDVVDSKLGASIAVETV